LDLAGLLTQNKVSLAILDMGFEPNPDFPEDWTAISNMPFVSAIGSENFMLPAKDSRTDSATH